MLERLSSFGWFYVVLGLGVPFLATLDIFPALGFSSLVTSLYTLIHAVLFLIAFLLLELVLSVSIRLNRLRKIAVLGLLFLTPYSRILFETDPSLGLQTPLVLCFLLGFLIILRDYFFRHRGSLIPGVFCAISLAFLEPVQIPFLIIITALAARKDRENAYLLFSSFMIPVLFWNIHRYNGGESFVLLESPLRALGKVLENSAGFTSDPVMLFLFLGLLLSHLKLPSESQDWLHSLSLSTLAFFPILSSMGKIPEPGDGPLCVLAASLIALKTLPNLRSSFQTLGASSKVLVCLGLFYCLLPFYERGLGFTVSQQFKASHLSQSPQKGLD